MNPVTNASPRPWRVTEYDPGPQDIYDADGFRVCTMGLTASSNADAALIVEAVNERDRLRDIVQRLCKSMQDAADVIRADTEFIGPFAPGVILRGVDIAALLREARAALVEEEAAPHA